MISTLTINQNNKVGDSDLLAVHSPVVFLVSADYTGDTPEYIYCDVKDGDGLTLGTFKMIPYQDLSNTSRQFMFIAETIFRGYMEDFEDFNQSENSLVYVDGLTKQFTLNFRDPDAVAGDVSLNIVASHAKRQFGDNPNMTDQYNNENEVIYAQTGQSCYVYFYNENTSNVLSLGESYQAKFIVSDISGFVQGATVTINGSSQTTNASGEASFYLQDGTYNYTIIKTGYITKTGSFGISGSNITLNVTIVELSVEPVIFDVDKKGINGIFTVDVYSADGLTLIDSKQTTELGTTVSFEIDLPESYLVEADFPCWDWEKYSQVLALTNLSSPVSLVPTVELPQVAITFSVTEFGSGTPLENVVITKNGTDDFGDPCYSGALSTNSSGIASKTVRGAVSPDFKNYLYNCVLTDYTTVSGSVNVNSDNLTVTVNIEMISEITVEAPTVTSDTVDDYEKDNFRALGEVVSDGGATLTEQGFVYAENPIIPTIAGDKVTVTPAVGTFNAVIPNLTPLTYYNVRAYAQNSEGLSYGGLMTGKRIPYEFTVISAWTFEDIANCRFDLENTDTVTIRFRVQILGLWYNTDQIESAGAKRTITLQYDRGGPWAGGEAWELIAIHEGHQSLIDSGTL